MVFLMCGINIVVSDGISVCFILYTFVTQVPGNLLNITEHSSYGNETIRVSLDCTIRFKFVVIIFVETPA